MAELKSTIIQGNLRVTGEAYASTLYENGTALSSKYLALSGGVIDASNQHAPLILKGGISGYREGLRIIPYGDWSDILLAGNDASQDQGTSANSWFIGNNNGSFHITRNGSDDAGSASLKCINNVWTANGSNLITAGNISNYLPSSLPANGGNADTVGGLGVHSGRNNEANKIVRTDGNGYLLTGYINSDSGDENNSSAPARIWGTNGSDSYLRTYNKDYVQVGYATSAGSATYVDCFNSGPDGAYVGGKLSSFYSWNQGGTTSGYSIGITVGGHPSDPSYGWQLIQNLWNDDLYYRRYDVSGLSGWGSWYKVLNPTNGLSREPWWNDSDSHSVNDLGSGITFAYTTHGAPTTGTLVSFAGIGGNCESYRLQLQGNYYSNELYFRNRNGDNSTWGDWRQIIHTGNIGSYAITSIAGYATQQWVTDQGYITSSGSCSYATSAGSAGSVDWDNVSSKPSTFPTGKYMHNIIIESSGHSHITFSFINDYSYAYSTINTLLGGLSGVGFDIPSRLCPANGILYYEYRTILVNGVYAPISSGNSIYFHAITLVNTDTSSGVTTIYTSAESAFNADVTIDSSYTIHDTIVAL